MKSGGIVRRSSESSIKIVSNGNDKDNRKNLSKSSEARKTVYERIEHQGLPRIPLNESEPYEMFRLIEKNLRNLPDSAAVYVDRDAYGKPYMFFVTDGKSRAEVAINKKYLREQTAQTLKTMARTMTAMCKNNPDLLKDIKKIQALARISPEARDLTAKELVGAVKDMQIHMEDVKSEYVTSKTALIVDKVELVVKHLNKFVATSDEDVNQICNDFKMQFPDADVDGLKKTFKDAKASAKVFSSKLQLLEKIDVKMLANLDEAAAFLKFASAWKKFHQRLKTGTHVNISTQSYKGFQDWGAEIVRLESLLSNELTSKKKVLSRSLSSGSLSASNSQIIQARDDKSSDNSSRVSPASQIGSARKVRHLEFASAKRLPRLPTIDSPRTRTQATQNILSSESDKELEDLISSTRMLDGLPGVEHLRPKLQARGKMTVNDTPAIIWQRIASTTTLGIVASLEETVKESENQEKSHQGSLSSTPSLPDSPEKNHLSREKTASLIGGTFSQSEASAEFDLNRQQSELLPFSAYASLSNLPKGQSSAADLLSEKAIFSTATISNGSTLSPEEVVNGLLKDFADELKFGSSSTLAETSSIESTDADGEQIEAPLPATPDKAELPRSLNQFFSPQVSRVFDDELTNLLSPGQPLFEIDDNNQMISYPLSPEKQVGGQRQNISNPQ